MMEYLSGLYSYTHFLPSIYTLSIFSISMSFPPLLTEFTPANHIFLPLPLLFWYGTTILRYASVLSRCADVEVGISDKLLLAKIWEIVPVANFFLKILSVRWNIFSSLDVGNLDDSIMAKTSAGGEIWYLSPFHTLSLWYFISGVFILEALPMRHFLSAFVQLWSRSQIAICT